MSDQSKRASTSGSDSSMYSARLWFAVSLKSVLLLTSFRLCISPLPIGEQSIVMSVCVYVCVCVCVSVCDHIFRTVHPIFTKFLVLVTHDLWLGPPLTV